MNSQTQWISGQWSVASGQRPAAGGRNKGDWISRHATRSRVDGRPSRGFTLIELLVTITIIGILAGMVMGVLRTARESARESATRATIAKLNNIIMNRYESYLTRRVP
ncbi:MAG: type II secretion system GspH family protein, partial [Planctomycetaceae bacterium]|nr:type II secretion system GspH family protein [Planctomycetaceae bacterium]